MEKTEILALIDKAIKGQGTNVDAGGALATILEAIVDSIPPKGAVVTITDSDLEGEITQKRHDEILCAAVLKYYECFFVQLAPTIQQAQQFVETWLGDNAELELVFGSGVEFDDDSASVGSFLLLYNKSGKYYLTEQEI